MATRRFHCSPLPIGVAVFATLALVVTGCSVPKRSGPLVIVGGGGTPREAIEAAVSLSHRGPAVVLPQASQRADAGQKTAQMFRDAGSERADVLTLTAESLAEDRAKLERAALIWFPGGSQNRLMERLRAIGVHDTIHARHRDGAVVGGTSAGAAVMSPLMITGQAELDRVERDGTTLATGLGLLPGTIVDQHFHRRRRFNRLLSAVISNPSYVGIGIDERTAIVVEGNRFDVIGESSVLVIEAPERESSDATILSAEGLRVHLLAPGMSGRVPTQR